MIEIAKFTFHKILKTGDTIEPEPYCKKLDILGLSIFPEEFLCKDLNKLRKRVAFHLFVDGKIYLKLPLRLIPFYPYPLMDFLPEKEVPKFYDLRTPMPDKTMNDRFLSLSANKVMCKLEIIDNIEYYDDDSVKTFDIAPFKINEDKRKISINNNDDRIIKKSL